MFRSATLRLTGWYLLILITLSIVFSVVIYKVAYVEVENRLGRFQFSMQQSGDLAPHMMVTDIIRDKELDQARNNLTAELIYVNIFVLFFGGFVSYLLARRQLLPIERAHEAQSRFTSDASHEFRTPLAVMKTEIEVVLSDKKASSDELRSILSSNLEEVDKLSKLAEMLLNLSRLDHAKLKLSPLSLNRVVKSIIKDFNLPQNRLKLSLKSQTMIKGNEMAIADLIKILIDNAIQYSPSDSIINIRTCTKNHQVKFEITNLGPGIKPDKIDHIFDRFYRADSSRTTQGQKSYGLGLALAKNIVELHGGVIEVCSILDKETTFTAIFDQSSIIQANPKK